MRYAKKSTCIFYCISKTEDSAKRLSTYWSARTKAQPKVQLSLEICKKTNHAPSFARLSSAKKKVMCEEFHKLCIMNYALSKVTHPGKGSYSPLAGKLLTSGGKVGEGYKQTIPATHVVTGIGVSGFGLEDLNHLVNLWFLFLLWECDG